MLLYKKYNFAFFHIPKTAGQSIYRFLDLHFGERTIILKLYYHEALKTKLDVLGSLAKNIFILAVVRNPLDIAVSQYFYYRQDIRTKNVNYKLPAMNLGFKQWVNEWYFVKVPGTEELPRICIADYLLVNGKLPDNLMIIRMEYLKEDIKKVFDKLEFNLNVNEIGCHKHRTEHNHYLDYYDEVTKQKIIERDLWCIKKWYPELLKIT